MSQLEQQDDGRRLRERVERIGRKIVVLSGKGGVGKSTVAANLAAALAADGSKVGLLDVDLHGPSIPRLMGLEDSVLRTDGTNLIPVMVRDNLAVVSIGFLARPEDAVIWRGAMKYGVIRQFLSEVAWGELDYLVVDCPPGTGDEPLSIVQMVGGGASGVIVTTPQDLAVSDVRRCVTFCRQAGLPIAGIVENMSGFVCPDCGAAVDLFGKGGGAALAGEMDIPFLGAIPIDVKVVGGGDNGTPFATGETGPAAAAFAGIVRGVREFVPEPVEHSCCGSGHCGGAGGGCGHEHGDDHECCGRGDHGPDHQCKCH